MSTNICFHGEIRKVFNLDIFIWKYGDRLKVMQNEYRFQDLFLHHVKNKTKTKPREKQHKIQGLCSIVFF